MPDPSVERLARQASHLPLMNALELKIPPPVVALCLALLMWLVASAALPFTPAFELPFSHRAGLRAGLAAGCVVIGQGISMAGMVSFRRARTTLNPLNPGAASALVRSGIFRLTRNPMYLGLLLTLAGWSAWLWSPVSLLFLPVFVLYVNRFQIDPEERALARLFGAEFAAYRTRVRKWV